MTPIIQYLKDNKLLEHKSKARLLKLKAARYILYDGQLYRIGFSTPLLKCLDLEEGNYILQEIYDRVYENHARGQSLAHKLYESAINVRGSPTSLGHIHRSLLPWSRHDLSWFRE